MLIPNSKVLKMFILKECANNEIYSNQQMIELISKKLKLSRRDAQLRIPSGTRTVISTSVSWAIFSLRKELYIKSIKKGFFQITKKGLQFLQSGNDFVNNHSSFVTTFNPLETRNNSIFLSEISFTNVRSLKDQSIEIKNGVNIIIGNNGTCKTTLLKSIGLSFCPRYIAFDILKDSRESFSRVRNKDCYAQMVFKNKNHLYRSQIIQTSFTEIESTGDSRRLDNQIGKTNANPDLLISAFGFYGAQRNSSVELLHNGDSSAEMRPKEFVSTLFGSPQNYVDPVFVWDILTNYFKKEEFLREHFLNTQKHLLSFLNFSKDSSFWIKVSKNNGKEIRELVVGIGDDDYTSFYDFSDGEKNVVLMIVDILYGISLSIPINRKTHDASGLVLIDEIENHLHPAMERKILTLLVKCFPNVQFIVTTHSPNVIMGFESANIISLQRKGRNLVQSDSFQINELSNSLSVSTVLSDKSLFNVPIFSDSTERKITRYKNLFNIEPSDRTHKEIEELSELSSFFYKNEIIDEPDLASYLQAKND